MNCEKTTEKNIERATITFSYEEYLDLEREYFKKKYANYRYQGYRPGKVPIGVLKKVYGKEFLVEDVLTELLKKNVNYDNLFTDDSNLEEFSEEKGVKIVFEGYHFPEVKVEDYTGNDYNQQKVEEVTAEDVDKTIDDIKERYVRKAVVQDGKKVENGNIVKIDFEGKIDGVAFEDGTAKDYELEIGSHTFIEGFEDQIIGMTTDETKDIFVKFPDDYQKEDLRGKDAVFTIYLHQIFELIYPEINDVFVNDISGFSTVEELRQNISSNILRSRERESLINLENKIIESITDKYDFEVPAKFVDSELKADYNDFVNNLGRSGISIDDYCKYINKTEEEIKEEMRPRAEKTIKVQVIMEKIILMENIKVTETEVSDKIQEMADSRGENVNTLKAKLKKENKITNIENNISVEKLFKMLKEKNNIKIVE